MKIHTYATCHLLLMVSAVCFLGFTGCNSIDAAAGRGSHTTFIGEPDPRLDAEVVAANRELVPR
jgi:hypothetical protein